MSLNSRNPADCWSPHLWETHPQDMVYASKHRRYYLHPMCRVNKYFIDQKNQLYGSDVIVLSGTSLKPQCALLFVNDLQTVPLFHRSAKSWPCSFTSDLWKSLSLSRLSGSLRATSDAARRAMIDDAALHARVCVGCSFGSELLLYTHPD